MIELLPRPEWYEQARCRPLPKDQFFVDRGNVDGRAAAVEVCLACPVRAACLEQALELNERAGIWGGFTEKERRPLRRLWKMGIRGEDLLAGVAAA